MANTRKNKLSRFIRVPYLTREDANKALDAVFEQFPRCVPSSRDLSHVDGSTLHLDADAFYNVPRSDFVAFLERTEGALFEPDATK